MAIRRPVMLNNLVHKPSALGVVVGVTICLLGLGPRLDIIDLVSWVHCNQGCTLGSFMHVPRQPVWLVSPRGLRGLKTRRWWWYHSLLG